MIDRNLALISVHGDPAVEIGGEEAGGQNVYVRCMGEALARQGWQVDMFSRRAAEDREPMVVHGDRCRTIRLRAGPAQFIPRQEIFSYAGDFVQAWQRWVRQQEKTYAIAHTNYWISGWVGLQLKQQLGLPMVQTFHSLGAVKYQSVPQLPEIAHTRLAVEKACLEQADRVIATSPQEREYLRSLVSSEGQIEVIPCGTDVHRFCRWSYGDARQYLGLDRETKMLFYIGRFDPRKGIDTLLRATYLLSARGISPLLTIVGGGFTPGQSDGWERDRLGILTSELGIAQNVKFTGRISDAELPIYLAAADVCVVPSHYEPFGLVAIEAMASGTPVVASQVGGLQFTVLSERTGLLVAPRNAPAFAGAIARILENPQWRSQLGETARRRVIDKFSWEGVAAQLSQVYEHVISATGDRRSRDDV